MKLARKLRRIFPEGGNAKFQNVKVFVLKIYGVQPVLISGVFGIKRANPLNLARRTLNSPFFHSKVSLIQQQRGKACSFR